MRGAGREFGRYWEMGHPYPAAPLPPRSPLRPPPLTGDCSAVPYVSPQGSQVCEGHPPFCDDVQHLEL